MKRSNTLLLLLAFLTVGSLQLSLAQLPDGYYKKYHIDQNFTGVEAVPSGWALQYNVFRSGTFAFADGVVKVTGSGSGTRGADLVFPTPQSNTLIGQPTDSIWFIEFDWTITGATVGNKNALGMMVLGSKSANLTNATTFYMDGIFDLYAFGDGFLHTTNKDIAGPKKLDIDSTFTGDPNERYAATLLSGQYPGFNRAGTSAAQAALINDSTKLAVTYANGKTYHITAKLNFSTQKVMSLTVQDNADPLNAQTVTDLPFLAPILGGSASTVPVENRKVGDLAMITSCNTRASNAGNGGNAALNVSYDNIQIYRPELSLGQEDVTINYKDRVGAQAKVARVVPKAEVSTILSLLASDKQGFIEGTDYFAYDPDATHTANAGKGNNDGESVTVAAGASLDVVFKRTAITPGTYVWTGAADTTWNELKDNFSVSGGAAMSYQNGNGVEFSKADAANKTILVASNMTLGEGNIVISAPGYNFIGTGRLEGTGTLQVNAAATLGFNNRLTGGAIIGTSDPIQINNVAAATQYATSLDNISLKLNPAAAFTPKMTGNGGTLNLDLLSDNSYTPVITGFKTVNIGLGNVGKATSNNWSNPFTTVFTDTNTVVNVTNITGQDTLPLTFAVAPTSVALAKVNLGDNTRLIHNGTPGAGATTTVKIGEISGTANSSIEGNSVVADNRTIEYVVGGLNTDAVFNGSIRPQLTKFPSRHVGTELAFEPLTTPGDTTWYIPAPLKLKKVGTGSWTVNGPMLFAGDITVDEGTLAIGNVVAPSITQIKVDTAATLVAKNIIASTGIAVNIGTLAGSLNANSISLTGSKLKMNVKSFAEGEYDTIVTVGDFTTIAAVTPTDLNILDITVQSSAKNAKATLIKVAGNADVTFNQVLVNGEDITANTLTTEGAKYVFVWDEVNNVGELTSLVDFTGVKKVSTMKTVASVEYYTAAGVKVTSGTNGFLIKKIRYTDGTSEVQKTIQFTR